MSLQTLWILIGPSFKQFTPDLDLDPNFSDGIPERTFLKVNFENKQMTKISEKLPSMHTKE